MNKTTTTTTNKLDTIECEEEFDISCFCDDSEETIEIWLDTLLETTKKSCVEELTAEEIQHEIDEVNGTIENEGIWASDDEDDMHSGNIKTMEAYLVVLNQMLENAKERV